MSIARTPGTPNVVYAGTLFAGVFKSTDGGSTWKASSAGMGLAQLTYALAVDPVTTNTVYAGASSQVYKSIDAGATWAKTGTGLPAATTQAIAVDPTNPQTVYAGLNVGLFKSTDGGATWASTAAFLSGRDVKTVVVNPADARILYVSTTDLAGIYKSTDSGANWAAASTGLGPASVYAVVLEPSSQTLFAGTSNGEYRSVNGGATWSTTTSQITGFVRAFDTGGGPGIVHAATDTGRVYRTVDGGFTWQGGTGLPGPSIVAVSASPEKAWSWPQFIPGVSIRARTTGRPGSPLTPASTLIGRVPCS